MEIILKFLSQKKTNNVIFLATEEVINHIQRISSWAECEEKGFRDNYYEELKKVIANQDGVN